MFLLLELSQSFRKAFRAPSELFQTSLRTLSELSHRFSRAFRALSELPQSSTKAPSELHQSSLAAPSELQQSFQSSLRAPAELSQRLLRCNFCGKRMLIPRTKFENMKGNFNFQIQYQLHRVQKRKFPFRFSNFVLGINIAFPHRK